MPTCVQLCNLHAAVQPVYQLVHSCCNLHAAVQPVALGTSSEAADQPPPQPPLCHRGQRRLAEELVATPCIGEPGSHVAELKLLGSHHADNVSVALAAVQHLLGDSLVAEGRQAAVAAMAALTVPGRMDYRSFRKGDHGAPRSADCHLCLAALMLSPRHCRGVSVDAGTSSLPWGFAFDRGSLGPPLVRFLAA